MKREKNLVSGAHIKVQRAGYTHHGIYIGKNQVIHYIGDFQDKKPSIRQDSLQSFQGNSSKIIRVTHSNAFPSRIVVKNAKSRLGETEYNLLYNNCESFATWCVTGKSKSEQVENVRRVVDIVVMPPPITAPSPIEIVFKWLTSDK